MGSSCASVLFEVEEQNQNPWHSNVARQNTSLILLFNIILSCAFKITRKNERSNSYLGIRMPGSEFESSLLR